MDSGLANNKADQDAALMGLHADDSMWVEVQHMRINMDLLLQNAKQLHDMWRGMELACEPVQVCYGWRGEGNEMVREYLTLDGNRVTQVSVKSVVSLAARHWECRKPSG